MEKQSNTNNVLDTLFTNAKREKFLDNYFSNNTSPAAAALPPSNSLLSQPKTKPFKKSFPQKDFSQFNEDDIIVDCRDCGKSILVKRQRKRVGIVFRVKGVPYCQECMSKKSMNDSPDQRKGRPGIVSDRVYHGSDIH